jgi:TRAP-type C4-dicarboxylate transport system permease small subunit
MNAFNKFEKYVVLLSKWFNVVAGIALVGMLVLVTADIIANKAFKSPIPGGIEFVSFMAVVAIAFAIAQTQLTRGHIEVEFIAARLPLLPQKVIGTVVNIFVMVLFGLLSWRSFIYGTEILEIGEVSMTRGIPFYPFIYAIGICSIVVFLVALLQLLKLYIKDNNQ